MKIEEDDYAVGYKKPPKHSRFKKGQSDNPRGRPAKKQEEKPASDLRSLLERVANETVEIGGTKMTMMEVELRSLQRKAAKDDVAASRHLAKLRSEAGCDEPLSRGGGVLLLPSAVPIDEWTAAAARQQGPYRQEDYPS